jgi:hypothetical protein
MIKLIWINALRWPSDLDFGGLGIREFRDV